MDPFDDELMRTIIGGPGLDPEAAGLDDMGHYLVAIAGDHAGRRLEIGSVPITIGRNERQTLVFAGDTGVSRMHARVSLVNGAVVAEDMGSTNGTFIGSDRLSGPFTLQEGHVLRVGRQLLKYERRSRRELARTQELDRDLHKASRYVLSLLPPPIHQGPVRAQWHFLPSAQLGGDAFGYYWLDANTFVFYLIDVSGHGVGSAMHSVSVTNVLRQRTLPHVDFRRPAEVLARLNATFEMDSHSGMFFTMWYGVYDVQTRMLTYSSAGHHAAYLVSAERQVANPLGVPAVMIGALPDQVYEELQTTVPADSALYLFSDGVFEVVTRDQRRWALEDFLPLLLEPAVAGTAEPERLYRAVRAATGPEPLEDDFSLLVLTFQ